MRCAGGRGTGCPLASKKPGSSLKLLREIEKQSKCKGKKHPQACGCSGLPEPPPAGGCCRGASSAPEVQREEGGAQRGQQQAAPAHLGEPRQHLQGGGRSLIEGRAGISRLEPPLLRIPAAAPAAALQPGALLDETADLQEEGGHRQHLQAGNHGAGHAGERDEAGGDARACGWSGAVPAGNSASSDFADSLRTASSRHTQLTRAQNTLDQDELDPQHEAQRR